MAAAVMAQADMQQFMRQHKPALLPIEQAAHDYLDQAVARLPAGLTVERHVLRGSPAERILDHAEQTAAGLIVMSTHGRSGIARFALGSVADRVVRGGSVPVLLTRQ